MAFERFKFNPAWNASENGKLIAALDKSINQPRNTELVNTTGGTVSGIASTSYVEYSAFTKTVETHGGMLSIKCSINGTNLYISLWIDGKMVDESSGSGSLSLFHDTVVGTGKHTIQVKYKTSGGTATISGGMNKLSAFEHF